MKKRNFNVGERFLTTLADEIEKGGYDSCIKMVSKYALYDGVEITFGFTLNGHIFDGGTVSCSRSLDYASYEVKHYKLNVYAISKGVARRLYDAMEGADNRNRRHEFIDNEKTLLQYIELSERE